MLKISIFFLLAFGASTSLAESCSESLETVASIDQNVLLKDRISSLPRSRKKPAAGKSHSTDKAIDFSKHPPESSTYHSASHVANFELLLETKQLSLDEIKLRISYLIKALDSKQARSSILESKSYSRTLLGRILSDSHFDLWFDLVDASQLAQLIGKLLKYEYSFVKKTQTINNLNWYGYPFYRHYEQLRRLYPKSHAIWKSSSKALASSRTALKLASKLDFLPAPWRKTITDKWLIETGLKAMIVPKITNSSNSLVSKKPVQFVKCGACGNMDLLHEETLQDFAKNKKSQDLVILKYKDTPLGSLKFSGNKSFIALNNIRNENGSLILALGMTYQVSEEIFVGAESALAGNVQAIHLEDFQNLNFHPNMAIRNPNINEDELCNGKCFKTHVKRLRKIMYQGLKLRAK